MGSIAVDKNGNMALGYSISSTTTFPSIRYTGREQGEPLGTMPQGEFTIVIGGGSQGFSERRGDDEICGGSGNDIINAGAGDDLIDGGPDNDIGNGGSGQEQCSNVERSSQVARFEGRSQY